jgi:hypothetical protein
MHENKYNHYRIPAGLLITFLEKALILIHMETHLNDVTIMIIKIKCLLCAERGDKNLLAAIYIIKPALL